MKISAIISDIDGTFIDDKGQVPEGIIEFCHELTDVMGIPVHFASGRSYTGAKKRIEKLGLAEKIKLTPGAYSDGAVIVGEGGLDNILHVERIDWDLMVEVDRFIREYRKKTGIYCTTTYETPNELYTECVKERKYFDDLRDHWDMPFTPLPGEVRDIYTAKEIVKLPIMAMSVIAHPEDIPAMVAAMNEMLAGRGEMMVTAPYIAHLTTEAMSKRNGVRKLCELLGYPEDEVLVLGDGPNDILMLQHFPKSIAMGNACEEAKRVAFYIGDHVTKQGWKKSITHMLSLAATGTQSEPTTQVSTNI